MVDTTLDDDEMPGRPGLKRAWIAGLLAVLILFLIMVMTNTSAHKQTEQHKGETAQEAYARLLGETRTGIRLARLEDFIAQHPRSLYINAARVQARALKTRENQAWAALTDALYDLTATGEAKTKARTTYLAGWGRLNRPAYFSAQADREADGQVLTFDAPQSRFARNANEQALAGSSTARIVPPRPQTQIQMPLIIKARVKTARRPLYPRKARRRGVNAAVTLALDIDEHGRITGMRVVSFQGGRYKKDFIKSARRAARRSRFYPKTIGGRPVPTKGYLRQYTFDSNG